jgi:hypothetical protein
MAGEPDRVGSMISQRKEKPYNRDHINKVYIPYIAKDKRA